MTPVTKLLGPSGALNASGTAWESGILACDAVNVVLADSISAFDPGPDESSVGADFAMDWSSTIVCADTVVDGSSDTAASTGCVAVAGGESEPSLELSGGGSVARDVSGASDVAGAVAGCSKGVDAVGAALSSGCGDVSGLVVLVESSAADKSDELVVPPDEALSARDADELVCAPPELCTIPVRGSVVDKSDDVNPEVEVDESDPDDGVELDVESDDASDVELEESDDDDALASEGSATATQGVEATPVPIPSATASAPTRPMYFALPIASPLARVV